MALSSDLILFVFAAKPALRDSFWSRIDTRGGDREQCWPWLGATAGNGYGNTRVGDKFAQAHRVAFVLAHGFLCTEDVLLHECDTPKCCNPYHTEPGTNSANMLDAKEKGRLHSASHGRKLSQDDEAELVFRNQKQGISTSALAIEFQVNQRTVRRVLQRGANA